MLNQECEEFLEGRGIDLELASRFEIYTDNIFEIGGNPVIVFPYKENDVIVNRKFRMLPKERFWQESGRKKLFWNVDALDDPALETGQMPLLICEGELDALVAIQCGFPLSVSVPDGAPPANLNDDTDSGANDQSGKYEFLWNARDKLKKVKRFVIAVDGDAPGQRLREELVRRLSAGRCSFVEYPLGCKDLNDVLIKYDQGEVIRVVHGAKQCPVKGLYRLSDYPDEGELQTFSTGWPLLDQHMRLFLGEFIVVTGIPQHGKSSFVLQLLANVAWQHGLRSAIFSPEMKVVPVIRDRFRSIRSKSPGPVIPEINAWIEDNFVFIGADPLRKDDEEDFDLGWIVDKATEAVLRDGIRILLIDPWNEVEHARLKGESVTDYVARGVRMLKRFARAYNVTIIVVAHPVKMGKNSSGEFDVPTLYDISDSAHWYNKADHGIVVYRHFSPNESTDICVVKSRFDEAGETGMVRMRFDRLTHRFEPLVNL